jgi:O-antigen/teichoic acid export membrane protein
MRKAGETPPRRTVIRDMACRLPSLRLRELSLVVGEGALGLAANLLAMVLVERKYGQQALGIYSYLVSFFHIAAYLAEFGIPRFVERETALHPDHPERQAEIWNDAIRALFYTGLTVAGLCCLSAPYDTSHTAVQEKLAAYFIIGLTIPVRNANRLRLAALHGLGEHAQVAKLQGRKRLVFVAGVFALLSIHITPSYLVAAFLLAELYLLIAARKKLKLPSHRIVWRSFERLRATLRQGYLLLFADEALETVLYIDLLILGIYLPSWDLGVYAETTILARLFLFIPLSVRPVLRQKYCAFISENALPQAARLAHRLAAVMFFVHSLLALFVLLYYPNTLGLIFRTRGEEMLSFRLFEVILPGLLLCASAMVAEPLYEALEQIVAFRRLILTVFAVNVFLNLYLIPFAGYFGAATATMVSMTIYFLLFGRGLDARFRPAKLQYLSAGAAVYVVFVVMRSVQTALDVGVWLLPVMLSLLFYGIGFFDGGPRVSLEPSKGGHE